MGAGWEGKVSLFAVCREEIIVKPVDLSSSSSGTLYIEYTASKSSYSSLCTQADGLLEFSNCSFSFPLTKSNQTIEKTVNRISKQKKINGCPPRLLVFLATINNRPRHKMIAPRIDPRSVNNIKSSVPPPQVLT